jgi:purine-binding chemotaxis protein CheW
MPLSGQRNRADPQKNLVGFVVGNVHYAVDIGRVRAIVNPLAVTPLPHTPPEITGVSDYRGDVVPVIDLRARFGLPPEEPTRQTKWILVDPSDRLIGIIVDEVTNVFGTGGEDLRPTPDVGGRRDVRGIMGVASHNGRLTFVLDTSRLIEIVQHIDMDSLVTPGAS